MQIAWCTLQDLRTTTPSYPGIAQCDSSVVVLFLWGLNNMDIYFNILDSSTGKVIEFYTAVSLKDISRVCGGRLSGCEEEKANLRSQLKGIASL